MKRNLFYYLTHPSVGYPALMCKLSDRYAIEQQWKRCMDYPLNLKNPSTFAEKLQWLKLYDRKPIYHQMVDKVDAKMFINSVLGDDYAVPTLGVYNCFEEIAWESLPQQFILKATHDSGSYFIVKDKNKVDKQICKKQLYVHWNMDYYKGYREWQYKGLKKRIIAEPLIANPKDLCEYKFFCFNGVPKIYQTCYDRDNAKGGAILNFYDIDSNLLDLHDTEHIRKSDVITPKPNNMLQMREFCNLLAKDTFFIRVDFYGVNGRLYIGELTLHENAGYCSFFPDRWNYILGSWIHLPFEK